MRTPPQQRGRALRRASPATKERKKPSNNPTAKKPHPITRGAKEGKLCVSLRAGRCPPVDFTSCLVPSPAFLDLFYLFSATGNKQVMPEPGEAEGTGGMRDARRIFFSFPLFPIFFPPPLPSPSLEVSWRHEMRRKSEIKGRGERWGGQAGRQRSAVEGLMVFDGI